MVMKFKGQKALRTEFPDAESIVQVRVITKLNSTIDVEGPVTAKEVSEILRLAMGVAKP